MYLSQINMSGSLSVSKYILRERLNQFLLCLECEFHQRNAEVQLSFTIISSSSNHQVQFYMHNFLLTVKEQQWKHYHTS